MANSRQRHCIQSVPQAVKFPSGGDMVNIMRKSEKARLITNKLLGVRSDLVEQKMYTTMPLPMTEITPSTPITKPTKGYHRGLLGENRKKTN
ncbi:hypothetical protein V1478_005238 [Vespula squamosa]|uniref:Uncharacterized protein n=1 Tax=Vespula squamosa TaxID=30214 RepID=A0ABD2BDR3_VESSQ